MNFRDDESMRDCNSVWYHERRFQTQPDSLFRYYLFCAVFIYLMIVIIKAITPMKITTNLQISFGVTAVILLVSLVCTYSRPEKLTYGFRIAMWLLVTLSLILCSTVDIVTGCQETSKEANSSCSFTWVRSCFGCVWVTGGDFSTTRSA